MAVCYWFTGLPCSGKTTLAKELLKYIDAELFDGDEVRETPLTTEGFSPIERASHLLRLGHIAKVLVNRNINVVVSCISPIKKVREQIRTMFKDGQFKEIYLSTSLETCKERDVKGMYKLAEQGRIADFTGVNSRYEAPDNADIVLNTSELSVEDCIDKILEPVEKCVLFPARMQPMTLAHKRIIDDELIRHKVVICLKFDRTDKDNPYTPCQIKEMIHRVYGNSVDVCVVPNFKEIVYGRGVGYGMRKVVYDERVTDINATRVRELKDCGMDVAKFNLIPKEIEDLV